MASGVAWNEDYSDPESDFSRQPRGELAGLRFLAGHDRVAPAGARFN